MSPFSRPILLLLALFSNFLQASAKEKCMQATVKYKFVAPCHTKPSWETELEKSCDRVLAAARDAYGPESIFRQKPERVSGIWCEKPEDTCLIDPAVAPGQPLPPRNCYCELKSWRTKCDSADPRAFDIDTDDAPDHEWWWHWDLESCDVWEGGKDDVKCECMPFFGPLGHDSCETKG